MIQSLMFLVLSVSQYGAAQAHSDSVFIYNAYTESAKVFEQATQPEQWKVVDDSLTKKTAAAFVRLNKFNKQNYAPIDELNREAIGVALLFPQPSDAVISDAAPVADAKTVNTASASAALEIAFKVLDEQTHFMTAADGKGKIPYVVMNYYAKGRILVKSEKLDPITFQPIQMHTEAPGLATSLN